MSLHMLDNVQFRKIMFTGGFVIMMRASFRRTARGKRKSPQIFSDKVFLKPKRDLQYSFDQIVCVAERLSRQECRSIFTQSLLQKHGLEIIVALSFPIVSTTIHLGFFSRPVRGPVRRCFRPGPTYSSPLHPQTTFPTSPRTRLIRSSDWCLGLERHGTLILFSCTIGSYSIVPHFFSLLQHFFHAPHPELSPGGDFMPIYPQSGFACIGNVFVFDSRTLVVWTENNLHERAVLFGESSYSGVIDRIRYIEQCNRTRLYLIVRRPVLRRGRSR